MTQGKGQPDVELAARAYIYGYPLVYDLSQVAHFIAGGPDAPVSGPFNKFAYARRLLGPETKFVTPNNDTLYVIAMCDIRSEPLVISVPDASDRYYVLQFIDPWTNNFAYIGRRATGTAEGTYLVVPWDYAGDVPAGMSGTVRAPSGVFTIAGRVQVNGEADLATVHRLQDGFVLTALSAFLEGRTGVVAPARGLSEPDQRVGEDLSFWENLRLAIASFPPPDADREFLEEAAGLGITSRDTPYADAGDELRKVLVSGEEEGKKQIESLIKGATLNLVNGWSSTLHLFDYNLDYLSLGTADSDEWKIADRGKAYVMRAIGARAGLWGNHGYEAAYAGTYLDDRGEQLNGAHRYEFALERTPPVDAFWSLTMYDTPDFHLVTNPLDRYSIGDRTEGLVTGQDGSLTIYMQKDSPGAEKESNWLPSPAGDFRPIMRMYQPGEDILNGSYVLPPITRVE